MKKLASVLLVFMFVVTMVSCSQSDKFVFQIGPYIYYGEQVTFYDEHVIENLSINLLEITEKEFMEKNNINVIKNHYDSQFFSLTFSIKYLTENNSVNYDVEFLGRENYYPDTYKIKVIINNLQDNLTGELVIALHFDNLSGESNEFGSKASIVYLYVRSLKINDDIIESDNYSFPRKLEYEKEIINED